MSVSGVSSAVSRVTVDYAHKRAQGVQRQGGSAESAARPEAVKKNAVATGATAAPTGVSKLRPAAQEAPLTQNATIDNPPRYSRADIESLLQIWSGEREAGQPERDQYDFNDDGRIDATDLGTLISRLGQPKPDTDPGEEPLTVQGLLERWNNGSDASNPVSERYDLNGDGRVDATDLGALLAQGGRIDPR